MKVTRTVAPGALAIDDHFDGPLDARWVCEQPGGGLITMADSLLHLEVPEGHAGSYTNAQVDDYSNTHPLHLAWRPPLRMEVRARASHPAYRRGVTEEGTLLGTAGFGFWDFPFSSRGSILRLPDAVWFFYASPPSNMALVPGSPGCGWKAQVVHTHDIPRALLLAPPTAASVVWAGLTGREAAAARWVRRFSGTSEAELETDLTAWHTYTLDWLPTEARFAVDGAEVLRAPNPPRRPLGFVTWIDNQYLVVTPRGTLRFGKLACARQWLDLDSLRIGPL